jgi:hypothetical protein
VELHRALANGNWERTRLACCVRRPAEHFSSPCIQGLSSSFKAIQAPPPRVYKKMVKNDDVKNTNHWPEIIYETQNSKITVQN